MPSWLIHLWYGTLLIRLEGYSPERFLNLCCANQIELWNLEYIEHRYQFNMTVRDYRRIKPLVKKTKVRLTLLTKFGLPFFLYRNRHRKLLFAGIVSFFAVLKIMSLFIWDIHFEGNRKYTAEILQEFLTTQEIRYGMKKSGIDCENLEAEIRSSFPEIIWVSARVTGTRLWIQVKENEVILTVTERTDEPRDLVAVKSGVITRMVVRSGKAKVKIGDQVEAGQVLVSGVLPVTNDAMETIATHYVCADADIYARTDFLYEQEIPLLKQAAAETGRKRKGLRVRVGSYSAELLYPKQTEFLWADVEVEHQLKIFENFWLPIYWGVRNGKECQVYQRNYTADEKAAAAESIRNQLEKKIIEKGVPIIENNVKILDSSLAFRVQCQMVLEEEISAGKNITIQEEIE